MKKIVLDTNIFNHIESDNVIKTLINSLINSNKIEIIVPANVVRELNEGPFQGVPDWFEVKQIADSFLF